MSKHAGSVQKRSPLQVAITAHCFGVPVAIQCRPCDVPIISAHLPFGCNIIQTSDLDPRCVFAVEAHNKGLFSVRRDRFTTTPKPTALALALKSLQKDIHLYIAEHAQHHVFVHAGVVVLKNRVIVFPGFSHAGKSTLVWSFIQAGATYYSDEYAVFTEDGLVYPFALPIGLRLDDGNKQLIMPDNIGTAQRKPDFIVFARYRPGAIWSPTFLEPAASLMKLLQHSIAIRRNPALVLSTLKYVSLESQTFVSDRGDAHQLLDWIASIA
jgi:hypothetical protein